MKYNTPELLPVGTIEATVLNLTSGVPTDSDTDPVSSRPMASLLEFE